MNCPSCQAQFTGPFAGLALQPGDACICYQCAAYLEWTGLRFLPLTREAARQLSQTEALRLSMGAALIRQAKGKQVRA